MLNPPNSAGVWSAPLPLVLPFLLMFLMTTDNLPTVVQRLKNRIGPVLKCWYIQYAAIGRKKMIEILLVLGFTVLVGCFRDTGFSSKQWQHTTPASGAAAGDPTHFLWQPEWLEPVDGHMHIHGLPDGQVLLKFGTFSWLQRLWTPSRDYGYVICGELEVCVGTFRVAYVTGNFAHLQLLSADGQLDREFWLRFPAVDRTDANGCKRR